MAQFYHMHPAVPATLTGECGAGNKHHSSCSKGAFTRANEVSCTQRSGQVPKKVAFKCVHDLPDATIAKLHKGWLVVEDGVIGIVEAGQVKKKSKITSARKSEGKKKGGVKKTKKPAAKAKTIAKAKTVAKKKTVVKKQTVAGKKTVARKKAVKGATKKS